MSSSGIHHWGCKSLSWCYILVAETRMSSLARRGTHICRMRIIVRREIYRVDQVQPLCLRIKIISIHQPSSPPYISNANRSNAKPSSNVHAFITRSPVLWSPLSSILRWSLPWRAEEHRKESSLGQFIHFCAVVNHCISHAAYLAAEASGPPRRIGDDRSAATDAEQGWLTAEMIEK